MLSSKRKEIFDFVESRFDDYDIERIHSIVGNLRKLYPFNHYSSSFEGWGEYGGSFNTDLKALPSTFVDYQKEIIYDLDDKKVDFYYNLMKNIQNEKMANMSNFVEFLMSGFLFYKQGNKVKTVLFNDR